MGGSPGSVAHPTNKQTGKVETHDGLWTPRRIWTSSYCKWVWACQNQGLTGLTLHIAYDCITIINRSVGHDSQPIRTGTFTYCVVVCHWLWGKLLERCHPDDFMSHDWNFMNMEASQKSQKRQRGQSKVSSGIWSTVPFVTLIPSSPWCGTFSTSWRKSCKSLMFTHASGWILDVLPGLQRGIQRHSSAFDRCPNMVGVHLYLYFVRHFKSYVVHQCLSFFVIPATKVSYRVNELYIDGGSDWASKEFDPSLKSQLCESGMNTLKPCLWLAYDINYDCSNPFLWIL